MISWLKEQINDDFFGFRIISRSHKRIIEHYTINLQTPIPTVVRCPRRCLETLSNIAAMEIRKGS